MTEPSFPSSFPSDTSPDALRAQYAALRRMSPSERLARAIELTDLVRSMAFEGLRQRHPDATEGELQDRFSDLVLGDELARKVREHRRDHPGEPAP